MGYLYNACNPFKNKFQVLNLSIHSASLALDLH